MGFVNSGGLQAANSAHARPPPNGIDMQASGAGNQRQTRHANSRLSDAPKNFTAEVRIS
jgi:hypothetical protein